MEVSRDYMNTAIIDVITRFPQIGVILREYDVGCVTCQVGTCLLKDIVAIHDLPQDSEREMMARIDEAISGEPAAAGTSAPAASHPDRTAATAATAPAGSRKPLAYSPPIRELVDEHVLIMRWVEMIPTVLQTADLNSAVDRRLLEDGIDFIRSYADRFHHAKEEDVLFGYFDQSQEIIQAMLTDHETARAHVRAAAAAIEQHDGSSAAEHLTEYGQLLTAHIQREDTILYPWMDRQLSTQQVGELFSEFAEIDASADAAAGENFGRHYARLLDGIGKWLKSEVIR